MQQCQDQLGFNIETPSDAELARRFADRQRGVDAVRAQLMDGPQHHQSSVAKKGHKTRNRKSKQQKKQERIAFAQNAREAVCEGIEVSPGTELYSGCSAKEGSGCGDCPECGG